MIKEIRPASEGCGVDLGSGVGVSGCPKMKQYLYSGRILGERGFLVIGERHTRDELVGW